MVEGITLDRILRNGAGELWSCTIRKLNAWCQSGPLPLSAINPHCCSSTIILRRALHKFHCQKVAVVGFKMGGGGGECMLVSLFVAVVLIDVYSFIFHDSQNSNSGIPFNLHNFFCI